jgi:hypothetical protein
MPHIEQKSRAYFDEKPHEAKTDGDVCYVLYTKIVKPMWDAEPRWKTYATIRKSAKDPRLAPGLMPLVTSLMKNGADQMTVVEAYNLAIEELHRLYVSKYEDEKIAANGEAGVNSRRETLAELSALDQELKI